MADFSEEALEKALATIASMVRRSEQVQTKFKEGTPQATLTKNRLRALHVAAALIASELGRDSSTGDFSREDLQRALPPIASTIRKCEKAQQTLPESTAQAALVRAMLEALRIASLLITKELNSQ